MLRLFQFLPIVAVLAISCGEDDNKETSNESGSSFSDSSLEADQSDKSCSNPLIETVQDLEKISGCTSITGDLNVPETAQEITNLNGLESIQTIEGSLFLDGPSLTNIDGLSNLTSVNIDVYIRSITLTNVNGLTNLERIGGNLTIDGCQGLTDLNGLDKLSNLDGKLTIRYLPKVETCNALEIVKHLGLPVEDAGQYVCGTKNDDCGEFVCIIIT